MLIKLLSFSKMLLLSGLMLLSASPLRVPEIGMHLGRAETAWQLGQMAGLQNDPGMGKRLNPYWSVDRLKNRKEQSSRPFWELSGSWADSVLGTLSREEKIGQLFMVAAYSNKDKNHEDFLASLIREQYIGGLIWFQGGPVRQLNRNNRLQAISKIPLLVGMDAEWGPSMRLDSTVRYPRQLGMGAIDDESSVYRFGAEAARQLKALGVHISFSPVIDINNNPLNPVIGDRSFGEDRINVALKGLAYMEGLQDNGVLACGKHFPGHGDTDTDSHHALPVIRHSWSRLDSVELYPFKVLMSQGLASVMTAHLHIPSLDDRKNRAASVSQAISGAILRDSLGFQGLAITDALNMKGVSAHFQPGKLEVEAFLAGNDILLFPENVPAASRALLEALEQGVIDPDELDRRVLRILQAKEWAGLNRYRSLPTADLHEALNHSQALEVLREIAEQRLTLLNNPGDLLPFKTGLKPDLALVDLGRNSPSAFQRELLRFGEWESFVISPQAGPSRYQEVLNKAGQHGIVAVALHGMNRSAKERYGLSSAQTDFLKALLLKSRVIVTVFGSPYAAELLPDGSVILIAYDEQVEGQRAAARALFGQLSITGRLPVSAGGLWSAGAGVDLTATRLRNLPKDEEPFPRFYADRIDSIVQQALDMGAAPGCRVLVAHRGEIIFNRAYGLHSYPGQEKVKLEDVYDLASITKVAATTIAVMKLYEEGRLSLDASIGEYMPEFKNTVVGPVKIRDILTHSARLQAWIPFYRFTLTKEKGLDPAYYRTRQEAGFDVEIAENVWMHRGWQDSIWRRIAHAPLLSKSQYKYSDLGFYLLARLVEELSFRPLDAYVHEEFYRPMGLENTGFNPRRWLPLERLVPTERDVYFRNQLVHGYVHDMGAAMMGGVAGHAGLFSTAEELAVIFQMLLNGGSYGGYQFLQPETIALFTAKAGTDSRRALGFDRPETDRKVSGPTSSWCSPATFGHSGFTGTVVWADPRDELVYVFLSNRVYPTQENKLLISENIRTRIQDEVYMAIREGSWNLSQSLDKPRP